MTSPEVVRVADDTRGGVDLEMGSNQVGEEGLAAMERAVRHGFARKVFLLLGMLIVNMLGVICIFMYVPQARTWAQSKQSNWLSVVSAFLFLCSIGAVACYPALQKRHPYNLMALWWLSSLAGLFVGLVTSSFNVEYIWIAFASTVGLVVVLGVFACQTRYDFSGAGPYLLVFIMLLFVFGFFGGYSITLAGDWQNGGRGLLFISIAMLVFSFYVVYDVQLVLGGKHRLQFGVDDYAAATLSLFCDFLVLFALMLGAFGSQS